MIDILVILGLIAIGLWLKWIWLVIIGISLLFAYLIAGASKKRTPAGGGNKPKVRPIIVKRRYDVESIYPRKMSIRMNPHYFTGTWWELAEMRAGGFLGNLVNLWRKR